MQHEDPFVFQTRRLGAPGTTSSGFIASITSRRLPFLKLLFAALVGCGVLGPRSAFAQPQVVDCSCLATQAVLMTNACQAFVPDMCQFTNCFISTVQPPPPVMCSQTPTAGTMVGPGTTPITVTVNSQGLVQQCVVNFQVKSPVNGPFALICGTNRTVECGTTWSFTQPTPTNYCCPQPGTPGNGITVVSVTTTTNGTCPEVITRTWTVRDACGAIASCSQTVTVVDTTPPVPNCSCLTNAAALPPPPMIVTNCSGTIPDLCLYAQFCSTDNCGPPTCSQNPPAGTVVGVGSHPFTVTLTDCASNSATCTYVFTVVAPPGGCCKLDCPPDINTNTCGTSVVVNYPPPVLSGNCAPGVTVVCTPSSGSPFPLGPTVVTCSAVGSDGTPIASCHFTVTVTQIQPQWSVICPNPAVPINVTGCPPVMPNLSNLVTIATNCPPPCAITVTQNIAPGTILTPGTHVVIVRACDCNGVCFDCDITVNATLSPNCCTTTPVLTLNSGIGSSGPLPGGSLDPQFKTGPPLFTTPNPYVPSPIHPLWLPNTAVSKWVGPRPNFAGSPIGNYFYTNRFFLCSTTQAAITGRWSGDDSGDMRLNGGPPINPLPAGFAFASWTPVSITSGFLSGWNELVFRITNSLPGSVTGLRTEIRGTACCNNCVTISCPPNLTRTNCPPGAAVPYSAPSATSGCGTIVSLACTPPSGSFFPIGTNTVTCTAIDSQGNAATCSFSILMQAAAPPVTITCPSNQVIYTCSISTAVKFKPTATGQTGPIVCTPPSGSTFPLGTNVVTCTATNACGSASCSFLVIVRPHLLGPPALTITAGNPDNFVLPTEPSPPSACMVAAFSGFPFWKDFDQVGSDRIFGHRFASLPNNVVQAELIVRMRPTADSGAANDGIFVGLPTCLFTSFRYSASIAALPAAGGNWNPGHAATTFTFNLGALNPVILPDINTQGYLDVVVHDDTTVDYMQLRLWRCPPPNTGIGVPFDLVGGATVAARPIPPGVGVPVGPVLPAICVFPNPNNPNLPSGITMQPGQAKSISFTTVLDFEAAEGAGMDIFLPPHPRRTNGMPYLSFRKKLSANGWCLKANKLYDDDPAIAYRSPCVGTNGDLHHSLVWDASNMANDALLTLFHLPGVTSVVMTVSLDLRTFEASVEFPHCIFSPGAEGRKGWDGCIYGNGTPSKPIKKTNQVARLIITPPITNPLPPVEELSLLAVGLPEFLVEDPEIETLGRKWGDGHVTLMKAYDDGETERLSFITTAPGGGVHTELGAAGAFSVGLFHFDIPEMGLTPDQSQTLRVIGGPPRGLTNRPAPPTIPFRLANGPDGVQCTVDFSDLAAETITVQLWNNGVLVGQGTDDGAVISEESPLLIDRWPDRFGRPAINAGYLALTSTEPMTISGIIGDEIRFIPGLPPGMEFPETFSRLEVESSDGLDSLLYDLQRTLVCPPTKMTLTRTSDGITVTWPGENYRLQGAENVTGPWFELGADSPVTLPASHNVRFFRLVCD